MRADATGARRRSHESEVDSASAAYLAFALSHALYHLANPADALSASEDVVNVVSLWVAVAVAGTVLWRAIAGAEPGDPNARAVEPDGHIGA